MRIRANFLDRLLAIHQLMQDVTEEEVLAAIAEEENRTWGTKGADAVFSLTVDTRRLRWA